MAEAHTPFGRILTAYDIERAMIATLQEWMHTYLLELEHQQDLALRAIARPRDWITASSFGEWPEDRLPSVIVICPGVAGVRPRGDGSVTVRWAWGLAVVAAADKSEHATRLVRYLTAAARAVLVQNPSLGGLAGALQWEDESYDDIADRTRTPAAGRVVGWVEVDGSQYEKRRPGAPVPDDPDATPVPDFPSVTSVELDLEKVAISRPLHEEDEE